MISVFLDPRKLWKRILHALSWYLHRIYRWRILRWCICAHFSYSDIPLSLQVAVDQIVGLFSISIGKTRVRFSPHYLKRFSYYLLALVAVTLTCNLLL